VGTRRRKDQQHKMPHAPKIFFSVLKPSDQ
jgi:hypothetical protein